MYVNDPRTFRSLKFISIKGIYKNTVPKLHKIQCVYMSELTG